VDWRLLGGEWEMSRRRHVTHTNHGEATTYPKRTTNVPAVNGGPTRGAKFQPALKGRRGGPWIGVCSAKFQPALKGRRGGPWIGVCSAKFQPALKGRRGRPWIGVCSGVNLDVAALQRHRVTLVIHGGVASSCKHTAGGGPCQRQGLWAIPARGRACGFGGRAASRAIVPCNRPVQTSRCAAASRVAPTAPLSAQTLA
jgi:hypothetical protein